MRPLDYREAHARHGAFRWRIFRDRLQVITRLRRVRQRLYRPRHWIPYSHAIFWAQQDQPFSTLLLCKAEQSTGSSVHRTQSRRSLSHQASGCEITSFQLSHGFRLIHCGCYQNSHRSTCERQNMIILPLYPEFLHLLTVPLHNTPSPHIFCPSLPPPRMLPCTPVDPENAGHVRLCSHIFTSPRIL